MHSYSELHIVEVYFQESVNLIATLEMLQLIKCMRPAQVFFLYLRVWPEVVQR